MHTSAFFVAAQLEEVTSLYPTPRFPKKRPCVSLKVSQELMDALGDLDHPGMALSRKAANARLTGAQHSGFQCVPWPWSSGCGPWRAQSFPWSRDSYWCLAGNEGMIHNH